MIFNSRTLIRIASDQGESSLPEFVRPVQTAQQQGATSQAEQLLKNVGEITQQKREQKIKQAPFGVFDLNSYQPHTSTSPGSVGGKIRIITSDMDGDGELDIDEVGRPKAAAYRQSLDDLVNSGKYTVMDHPMSELAGEPRVQRFLKAAGMSSLPVYISAEHKKMVDKTFKPFLRYVHEEELHKNLAAASAAGHEFVSDSIRDIDDPAMRMLIESNPLTSSVQGFYSDKPQTLNTTKTGVDYCVCGQHRNNHSNTSCRNFLPITVADSSGNYVNGNQYRASQSPLRAMPSMQEDTLQHALEGVYHEDHPDMFVSNEADPAKHIPTVFISDQTPFNQRIINKLTLTLNRKSQSKTLKAIGSQLVNCTACNASGKINQARSGVLDNPSMIVGMHGYEDDIDPDTGELTLKKVSGRNVNEWASRGTAPNVCPVCDHRNVSENDVQEYINNYKGVITPGEVIETLKQNPGKKLRIGKPSRVRDIGFVRQMVDHQPGNPVYLSSSTMDDAGIAYGKPDPKCNTCGGSNEHRDDGKPCDCRIADPSHMDIDNPVAIPGAQQEPIDKDGNIHVPLELLRGIYKSQGKEAPDLFKEQRVASEHILPNENLVSSRPDFFVTENNSATDRKVGIQRFKGKHGSWSSWVLSDGKPALNDQQQNSVAACIPSGIVISPDQREQFKKIRSQINSSPNAKECSHSEQLSAISSFLQNSLDSLAPTAGARPDIPSRAIRMPNRLKYVATKFLSSPDVDLDSPAFVGYHEYVLPHIAGIEDKVNKLKKRNIIRPEDEQFNGLLKSIYEASSKSAQGMQDFGSLSVDTADSPGTSSMLFKNAIKLAQHVSSNYGEDTAKLVMQPIAEMVAPYIKSSNKINA
jgi:hypothetical protein